MIKGGRIISVEAKRDKPDQIKGLSINITIDDVTVKGKDITIAYTYNAKYEEGVGTLLMKGEILLEETEKKAKEVEKGWKEKEKKALPEDMAELVLNSINYVCGTNGTLAVKIVNLSPPMLPPRITLAKGAGATARA